MSHLNSWTASASHPPAYSSVPYESRPWRDDYDNDPWWRHEPQECGDHRSVAEVLWSITATYLACLIAYGQLQYFFQGERSVLKIAYKLAVFVILPLYPACSLLVEALRTVRAWQRDRRLDSRFLLSRIIGLRIVRLDGIAESLETRHFRQYSWTRKTTRLHLRVVHLVVLLLVSSQCIGTLIRTISRLSLHTHYDERAGFDAFLAEDFESFFLSIGALGILAKSCLAWFINMEWKRNEYEDSRAIDMSSRLPRHRISGIFTEQNASVAPSEVVSEIFLGFHSRLVLLLVLYISSWIILGIIARNALAVFVAWAAVSVLALAWLRRSEAEVVPGGKEVFVSGFCACFLFLIPRANFYISHIRDTDNEDLYFVPKLFPWPLIVLATLMIFRMAYLHYYDCPYSSSQSRLSHLGLVILGVMLLIVLPAYVFSAAVILDPHDWGGDCLPQVLLDPHWVPSL